MTGTDLASILTKEWLRIAIVPQLPCAELLTEDAILFEKVVNDMQLALVDPAGKSDQHEPEWIRDSRAFRWFSIAALGSYGTYPNGIVLAVTSNLFKDC
jgi:hypothetical protein